MVRRLFVGFFFLLILTFSFWLMDHTFGYDQATGELQLATTVWSDFGSHIPLIRSFSFGNQLEKLATGQQIEYPLFPGEKIRYHFLFYALVGLLEKIGLPLDWALNIPSALGIFFMLVMIYLVASKLFARRLVGLIAVVFALFNGSLSFISYFQKQGWSTESLMNIVTNTRFPSFGPWDEGIISAFWNLNIFTNQRHLALSYGIALFIIYVLLKIQEQYNDIDTQQIHDTTIAATGIGVGILLGILLFLNQAAAAIALLFVMWLFLTSRALWIPILISFFTLTPLVVLFILFIHTGSGLSLSPGYLLMKPIGVLSFLSYWFHNLGFHSIFIILSVFLVPKKLKLFFVPLGILFIIGNIMQLSPDMINNHKLFNFFLLIGSMYSAFVIVRVVDFISFRPLAYFLMGVIILPLTLSGVVDFFVIYNDTKGVVLDRPISEDVEFFITQTKQEDIILNSTWFYHPASLAGRSIYAGYPYFTWSYGYDKDTREEIQLAVYRSSAKDEACEVLRTHSIDFIELSSRAEAFIKPNYTLFESAFTEAYRNNVSGMTVYDVHASCQ